MGACLFFATSNQVKIIVYLYIYILYIYILYIIIYTYIKYNTMSVLGKCLQINKSNLFAQSSRTPFSLTYFIIVRKVHEKCHFKFRGPQINCEMRK